MDDDGGNRDDYPPPPPPPPPPPGVWRLRGPLTVIGSILGVLAMVGLVTLVAGEGRVGQPSPDTSPAHEPGADPAVASCVADVTYWLDVIVTERLEYRGNQSIPEARAALGASSPEWQVLGSVYVEALQDALYNEGQRAETIAGKVESLCETEVALSQ